MNKLQWFALLTPNEGEIEMLRRILNYRTPDNVVLRLFTNNTTPAEAHTIASYTELAKAGYTSKTLTGVNWTISTSGSTSAGTFAQITFTLTGQCTCYGYYISCSGGAKALYAERFTDGPYAIPSGGGSIKITPRLELD